MTDEQKFRLLEWMKAVTIVMEAQWPVAGENIRGDLKRFEQSLELDDAKTAFRPG